MTFKEHQDKLRGKRYDSIPTKELNKMVIAGEDLDRVANSCQRLIIKVMGTRFFFNATSDDVLLEYVQVCNAALAESFRLYKEEKIDFAYFAYIQMINAMNSHHKYQSSIVKSSIVEGERMMADYLYIDAPLSDDEESFDIPYQPKEKVPQIDLELIYEILKSKHHLFKHLYIDVYAAYLGMNGYEGKTQKEIAADFGISNQRVAQIVKDVKEKMQDCDLVVKYLTEFI